MNEIKTIKDYVANKSILKGRHILYEEIIDAITDELGFKYFSLLFKKGLNQVMISKEIQINYFTNIFLDTYVALNKDQRNVFYEIAQVIYAMDKEEKWQQNNENRYKDDFVDLEDRIFEFKEEFDENLKEKIKNWNEDEKVREPLESGHTIALAFYLIDTDVITNEYLQHFCIALEDLIVFVGHTEFYNTEVGNWLNKVFGNEEKPFNFEFPKS